ncbi:MAG: DUF2474 family protein [Lysobacterales bacterium]
MKDQLPESGTCKKLGWFVLLWLGGVLAVAMLAWIIRAVMPEF